MMKKMGGLGTKKARPKKGKKGKKGKRSGGRVTPKGGRVTAKGAKVNKPGLMLPGMDRLDDLELGDLEKLAADLEGFEQQ